MAEEADEKIIEISPEEIFMGYDEEDVNIFVKELFFVFSIAQKIDNDYGEGSSQAAKDIKKFKMLMKDWELKYRDIILDFRNDGIQCRLRCHLKDSVQAAVSIIRKMNNFEKVEIAPSKVNAIFSSEKTKEENTVTLEVRQNTLELIYSKEDMLNPKSPEFRLCTYYAMKDGYDKKIELEKKYRDVFSFSFEEAQKYDWQNRWNVRFGR